MHQEGQTLLCLPARLAGADGCAKRKDSVLITCFNGPRARWLVVLMAIVGLSPVPLALPSGLALAVIGLIGAAVLTGQSERFAPVPLAPRQRHG